MGGISLAQMLRAHGLAKRNFTRRKVCYGVDGVPVESGKEAAPFPATLEGAWLSTIVKREEVQKEGETGEKGRYRNFMKFEGP